MIKIDILGMTLEFTVFDVVLSPQNDRHFFKLGGELDKGDFFLIYIKKIISI